MGGGRDSDERRLVDAWDIQCERDADYEFRDIDRDAGEPECESGICRPNQRISGADVQSVGSE